MKGWAITGALAGLGAAVVGAVAISAQLQANSESLTHALTMAERARAEPKPASAPSVAARASATPLDREPGTAATAAPPAVASAAVVDAAPAPTTASGSETTAFKQTATYNGAPVFVPEGCQGQYDLILHFHGSHPYVRELVEKAAIPAVVGVFNAGNGAEKYAQAYHAGGTLNSLLRQISMASAAHCGAAAKPRRVALSAWSAGYGAVEKLLSRQEDRERVDAVLLADGLHAAFMDPFKRTFAPNALQPFREFGLLAKQKQKLFAITHSSIMTDGYGSTTECSKLLLEALDVPSDNQLISGAEGDFSIEGSPGADKSAHVAQFRQMDATLLSKLRARWSRTP
jgi:hypothetical protein